MKELYKLNCAVQIDGRIIINHGIEAYISGDLERAMETVKINYPEIFN